MEKTMFEIMEELNDPNRKLTFEYDVHLKEGYKPIGEREPWQSPLETTVKFRVEAKCRAEADRMVKALLADKNVIEYGGVCISD